MNFRQGSLRLARWLLRKTAPAGTTHAVALWHTRRAARKAAAQRTRAARVLADRQSEFDRRSPVADGDVRRIAAESTLIVFEGAPFTRLCALVTALSKETIQPRELLVVDTTPEVVAGAGISAFLTRWRFQIPLIGLTIVHYDRQDVHYAHAMALAARAAAGHYWWFAGETLVPGVRLFEYLLKTHITEREPVLLASWIWSGDGAVHAANGRHCTPASPTPSSQHGGGPGMKNLLPRTLTEILPGCSQGIFGGSKALLAPDDGDIFDPLLLTQAGAIADLADRVRRSGARTITASTLVAFCTPDEVAGHDEPWQTMHDTRYLANKRAPGAFETARTEIVCPFHRGDVVLAIQVAAHLRLLGKPVRLHVQPSMRSWVEDIAPGLDVEAVAVEMPPAERTYPELLKAYRLVVERPDASARIARAHPQRSLSLTDRNLLDYLLEQVGLPSDTRLENVRPPIHEADREYARHFIEKHGKSTVFVHPFGGWHLKTIPPEMLSEMVRRLHAVGLKVVQIGGHGDTRSPAVDEAILENFLPSRWAAVLESGAGFIGVDSWTAHFASILDIPQITCFGSTHPKHVKTKQYFKIQINPARAFGPAVNCSPCNSLTCLAFPGRSYCTGYAIDDAGFDAFVALALQKNEKRESARPMLSKDGT
ncbi:MAG: glycosyltransferase family 9 protein [Janthinobacterium lividum]